MPLLDHFHPPLADAFPWDAFHTAWANGIMRLLNRELLPPGYYAAAQVHVGGPVEIDVATFHQDPDRGNGATAAVDNGGGALATATMPTTVLTMPAVFPDVIEVQIFQRSTGHPLVAAVELISPGNKDRPDTRRAYVTKCASYLQQAIGLLVVDIVTQRQCNLHDALIDILEQPKTFAFAGPTPLYTVSYHPRRQPSGDSINLQLVSLELGQALPVMPLALRGAGVVQIDLEATYAATCVDCRLSPHSL
jgi:Protein of unknown function (DUF4058)